MTHRLRSGGVFDLEAANGDVKAVMAALIAQPVQMKNESMISCVSERCRWLANVTVANPSALRACPAGH